MGGIPRGDHRGVPDLMRPFSPSLAYMYPGCDFAAVLKSLGTRVLGFLNFWYAERELLGDFAQKVQPEKTEGANEFPASTPLCCQQDRVNLSCSATRSGERAEAREVCARVRVCGSWLRRSKSGSLSLFLSFSIAAWTKQKFVCFWQRRSEEA
eukprot:1508622-Rhodomonas_salina.1